MTFDQAIDALRQAIIETPFPDDFKGVHARRTSTSEPYAYRYHALGPSYLVFLDKASNLVIWHTAGSDNWQRASIDILPALKQFTNWRIEEWNLGAPPWEVTSWIIDNRGLS